VVLVLLLFVYATLIMALRKKLLKGH
jgi:hypothetical protein